MPPRNALAPVSQNAFSYGFPTMPYASGNFESNPNAALKEFVFIRDKPNPSLIKPRNLSWMDNFIQAGLDIYNRNTDKTTLPANKRIFLESVLENKKTPVTESDFSPEELAAIKQLIFNKYKSLDLKSVEKNITDKLNSKNALSVKDAQSLKDRFEAIQAYKQGRITQPFLDLAGELGIKPAITDYYAYGKNAGSARTVTGSVNPEQSIATTLGRFSYEIDPVTQNLVIVDKYDFNTSLPEGLSEAAVPIAALQGPSGIYGLLRDYAGHVLPEGKGRNVRIQLNSLAPPNANYNRRK